MPVFSYSKTLRRIRETEKGQERDMYQYLRDMFAHVLEHENIKVDSTQEGGGGISPDLAIRCDTGVVNAKGHAIYHDWIVVEAKSERGVFLNEDKREEIFDDKQKYIRPETEWFVMVDPECVIVRPIAARQKTIVDEDKIFRWQDFPTAKDFKEKLQELHADNAADSPALTAFRAGDLSRIAVVKVDVPDEKRAQLLNIERERLARAKKDFLDVIRSGTKMLQSACQQALHSWAKQIASINNEGRKFDKKWDGYYLTFDPLDIKGKKKITSKEERQEHDAQVRELKKTIKKNPAVAKLALAALPAYRRRSGKKSDDPFTAETANLILARVLLLRFFEDHNFFNKKKYVCNGGVAALQEFMGHYEEGYTVVLREAYKKGWGIYAEAFDETDLDWVLESPDKSVSRAIELTMMLLSRFNFSTVSGDILTGIYDRFLDKEQRKAMGEFYTPPSVARYIVRRLDIQPTDSVFDPACGSGTFLLEAFEHMTKGDIRSGRGDYEQANNALVCIGGNDINPFSAVITQIQTLWHLLPLKSELKKRGFPEIRIAGGINSITANGDLQEERDNNIYADINRPAHDAVIGNPPYVRPERSGDMDKETQNFYNEIGGAKKNYYDLFVYKALKKWCREADEENAPGRLGFVLPLSFCDSGNSAPLRRLFALDGKFRLLEIVDMEAISPLVFDAAVNPIVLLAENRPATAKDKIVLRVAGEESVVSEGEFDLTRAPESEFNYAEVFSADGRILTKLNAKRKRIVNKMRKTNDMLADIARIYWVGIGNRSRIEEWSGTPPAGGLIEPAKSGKRQQLKWKERRLLGMGAATRKEWKIATNGGGFDYYKGENISACLIEGEPAKKNLLPDSLNDSSFWRYRNILPNVGYAFLRIALGVTAVRFNPHERAFLNTATLLFPNEQWENFPLDIVLTSRLYQFYYACYLREGSMSHSWRSHLYPRTLEEIPLPSTLLKNAARLGKLRESFLSLCENINRRADTLNGFLREVETVPLKDACRDANLDMRWSDGLQNGRAVKINAPKLKSAKIKNNRLLLKRGNLLLEGDEWLEIDDADIMRRVAAALITQHGRELKKGHFQKMPIPINAKALADFEKKVRRYDSGAYEDDLEKVLSEVDAIVGAAFGLSEKEIKYVQKEMREDGFLRNIHPNMPYVERRRRGLSNSLASSARYERKED